MNEQYDFSINPSAPLFVIGVVSEMVHLPIWTLRKLDDMGVVTPARMGKARCYSQVQIRRLYQVRYLLIEKGIHISGIKVVLELTTTESTQPKKEGAKHGKHKKIS